MDWHSWGWMGLLLRDGMAMTMIRDDACNVYESKETIDISHAPFFYSTHDIFCMNEVKLLWLGLYE